MSRTGVRTDAVDQVVTMLVADRHIATWDGREWVPWCEFDKLTLRPSVRPQGELCPGCLALAVAELEEDLTYMATCTYCGGKGKLACVRQIYDPNLKKMVTCPECKGSGSVTCPHCGGSGQEPTR